MKDDITRRAVLRAVAAAQGIAERFAKQVPYGPTRVGMKPAELRKKIEKMSPDERRTFAEMIGGPEVAMEFMKYASA